MNVYPCHRVASKKTAKISPSAALHVSRTNNPHFCREEVRKTDKVATRHATRYAPLSHMEKEKEDFLHFCYKSVQCRD